MRGSAKTEQLPDTLDVRRTGPWRILVLGASPSVHLLPEGSRVIIGRAEGSDIVIDDPAASRSHAVLEAKEALRLEDLGSSNGTRLRNRKLESGEQVELTSGDVIEVGATSLIVQRATALAPEERPRASVGEDPMQRLRRIVERVARSTISVLVLGETGVGKDVLTSELHQKSSRADKPMLRLNCAALAANLLESELFGHEKGAFTGADRGKPGLLEAANGGTVLLDEVGELPAELQPKLLRVLENREVLPVGGLKPRPLDVRFLAATNRDLEAEVAAGRFRQDLYFRLNGITLAIPPLRERTAEIVPMAKLFLAEACAREGIREVPAFTADAVSALERHSWPGNLRELRNVVDRALLLCAGDPIAEDHLFQHRPSSPALPHAAENPPALSTGRSLREERDDAERKRILAVLDECGGNQTRAAEKLGISRRTLVSRLTEYGLTRPRTPR